MIGIEFVELTSSAKALWAFAKLKFFFLLKGKIVEEGIVTFTSHRKLPIIFQSKEIFMDENLNASWGRITFASG